METKAKALIRQGALTTVGALGVYGVLYLGIKLASLYAAKKHPATGGCGCGCGGSTAPASATK